MNELAASDLLLSPWALALLALLLERWLPWPEHWHPLAVFRLFANYLQIKVNQRHYAAAQQQLAGWLAVALLLLLTLVPAAIVVYAAELSQLVAMVVLLVCLRQKPYLKVLDNVQRLAKKRQKRAARALLTRITYRDCDQLSLHGLAKTALELRAMSIIQHRFVPLISWLIGGPILCLALRVITELYQLWPVSHPRYRNFGLASRALYAVSVELVTVLAAATAHVFSAARGRRPRQQLSPSLAWLWSSAWWLDALSRLHNVSLGGPIKVHGQRLQRQRFAGRPAEHVWQQTTGLLMRWQKLSYLLLLSGALLGYIYRS
ncbi:MAG: cobalamin biosynthesis protein [Pseudomonadota bacterium]